MTFILWGIALCGLIGFLVHWAENARVQKIKESGIYTPPFWYAVRGFREGTLDSMLDTMLRNPQMATMAIFETKIIYDKRLKRFVSLIRETR